MIRPVCVDCNIEMRVEKNGAIALQMAYDPPEPYKAVAGDLYVCPRCGHRILTRFAGGATWHNHDGEDRMPKGEYVFRVDEHAKEN